LALPQLGADAGAVLVGPGRLDELDADVAVAGLGQMPAAYGSAARVLRHGEAAERHEGAGSGNRRQSHPLRTTSAPESGYPPVGAQPGDLVGKEGMLEVGAQLGLHASSSASRASTTAR